MKADCLFCRIVGGEVPASVVRERARSTSFRDTSPQAPTHVLIVPKAHFDSVADLAAQDPVTLHEMHELATEVAEAEGIAESGYRLVYNTGRDGQQSVQHVHLHLLGGRAMSWPPG